MNNTFDAVISVRELKELLKAAQADQKAHGAKTTHCIVLRGLTTSPASANDNPILCSASLWESVHNLKKSTAEYASIVRGGGAK